MKLAAQKKKLIRTAAIAGGVVLLAIAITAGAMYAGSYMQDDLKKTKSQMNSLNRKQQGLEKKIAKAKESLQLYETITQENGSQNFTLDRDQATARLNQLNERYRLSNLSVSISPVKELKNGATQNSSGVVIYSEVALQFKGISDELILGFVNEISRRFVGYVNITEFSMTKQGDINGKVLYGVSKGKKPVTVSGSLKFLWLGLKLDQPDEDNTEAAGS